MTMFDQASEDGDSRSGVGWSSLDPVAFGRRVNLAIGVLGAVLLGGYFLTVTSGARTPAPAVVEVASPTPAPLSAQLASSGDTATVARSIAVYDKPTGTSTIDLMKAAFGALLTLVWVVIGGWFAVRRSRMLPTVAENESCGDASTYLTAGTGCDQWSTPTCERRWDETRLVPQYLRLAEFPAMKQDLLGMARVRTDEGRALRRLEIVPDRRYSSLRDLITEFR
jgi:hypothetical protein